MQELELTELLWIDQDGNAMNNPNKTKQYPTESEKEELKEMLFLDNMIYDFFRQKLKRQWQTAIEETPELIAMRDALKCAHDTLLGYIQDGTTPPTIFPTISRRFYTMNTYEFTQVLLRRQQRIYGA
mmetsp:Transcript_18618/g.33582  ORF Transcript_18618/g.33582 Transcript_18618/m.33582 type:complete len:127 (+) Transcript_18618:1-381(+)